MILMSSSRFVDFNTVSLFFSCLEFESFIFLSFSLSLFFLIHLSSFFLYLSFLPLSSSQKTKTGLTVTVDEGDYDALVAVMIHLLAVKDRQPNTDNMFEPLKQTIELLKTYDQEMSDEIHTLLEVSPFYYAWF